MSHSTDTHSETSNENVENNNDNLNNLNNEDLEEVPLIIKPEESKSDVGRHDTKKIIETYKYYDFDVKDEPPILEDCNLVEHSDGISKCVNYG